MQTALPSLDCLVSCFFILIFQHGLLQLNTAALAISECRSKTLTEPNELG
jgi:hypothetical protein